MLNLAPITATELVSELKTFRAKSIAAENAASPLARTLLAALDCGATDEGKITIEALKAYGFPRTPSGKVADKLSGLRYAVGGDAARKTIEKILWLHYVSWSYSGPDATDAERAHGDAMRAVIAGFCLETKGAAKSLAACVSAIQAAIKAFVPEPSEGEGQGEGETGEAPAAPAAPAARPDIADMASKLAMALASATDAERDAAFDAITALASTINALEFGEVETLAEAA